MIKKGVTFNGIQPECVMGIMVAREVLRDMGLPFLVTSICDGQHSARSLHYVGLAFDIRTWADDSGTQLMMSIKQQIAKRLRETLGPDWDVVIEDTHIHCEFDPK